MAEDSILVKLGIRTDDFQRGLQVAKRQVDSFSMGLFKSLTLGFAGGIGLKAIGSWIKGTAESINEIAKGSKRVGVSVEGVQSFIQLTKGAWDAETAIDKLGKLSEMIGSARNGDNNAVGFFKRLGIELNTSSGEAKNTEQVLTELLDKLSQIPDISVRAKLLSEVFKRGGDEIAAYINRVGELEKLKQGRLILSAGEINDVETKLAWWKGVVSDIDKFQKKILTGGLGIQNNRFIQTAMGALFFDNMSEKEWDKLEKERLDALKNQPLTADLKANAAQEEALLKDEEEIKKLKYEQLQPIAKKRQLEEERLKILNRIGESDERTYDHRKAINDLERNDLELNKVQLDIQKQAEEVDKRQADLREKKNRLEEKALQLSQAQKDVEKAKLDMEISREDRRKFTVSDLAKYEGPTNRFARWQMRGAKEIEWAETMAKRAELFGNTRAAENYQSYSERVRSMLPGLTSTEQDLDKNAQKAVLKSEQHLMAIRSAYEHAGKEVPQ